MLESTPSTAARVIDRLLGPDGRTGGATGVCCRTGTFTSCASGNLSVFVNMSPELPAIDAEVNLRDQGRIKWSSSMPTSMSTTRRGRSRPTATSPGGCRSRRWRRRRIPISTCPGFAPNMQARSRRSRAGTPIARSTPRQRCGPSLSELGIDIGILFPDHMLLFAAVAEHRVRHGALPGLQPLADGGVAGRGAGSLRRRCWPARRTRRSRRARSRRYAKEETHRRRLPADRRRQSSLGTPQVRPDHGRRGGNRAAGLRCTA